MAGRDASTLMLAWLLFCAAIAVHVADESASGFLAVYNPTVLALRERLPWLPMPVFTFRDWLTGLAIGIAILLSVSALVARGARGTRPVAFVLSIVMIANGLGHIAGTVFGRTVASVQFARPMPGFYSSPLLIAASIYVLIRLRKRRQAGDPEA